MTDLVFWTGPVTARNLSAVRWRRPTKVIVQNSGTGGAIGSSAFASFAQGLGADPLATLASQHGATIDQFERVALAGFSAAHGLIDVVLRRAVSRKRVSVVGSFDAYFTGASRSVKPGYDAFARMACDGARVMVMTTSHVGGPGYPPANEAVRPLVDPLGLQPAELPACITERPATVMGRGGFVWADYANLPSLKQSHLRHATRCAPQYFDCLLAPALAGDKSAAVVGSGNGSGGGGGLMLLALLAAALGASE